MFIGHLVKSKGVNFSASRQVAGPMCLEGLDQKTPGESRRMTWLSLEARPFAMRLPRHAVPDLQSLRSSSYHACKVLQSSARQLAKDVGCSTQENLNGNVNVMHAARFLRIEVRSFQRGKATPLLILREAFVYILFKGIGKLGKLKCLRACVCVCVIECVCV